MKKVTRKMVKLLEDNEERYEVVKYEVKEIGQNNEVQYIVHNLSAEVEDGICIFDDIENVLQINRYVLSLGVLEDSIQDIQFADNSITIILKNSSITIQMIR